jgi:hypothetical protein
MHISFKIIKFYFTLPCSTCFGHHCVHHQELSTTAPAASGHRVVKFRLRPSALFCCYSVTTEQGWRTQPKLHHNFFHSTLLNMFRTPLFPSSGALHYCTCNLWSPCGVVSVASSSPVLLLLSNMLSNVA